MPNDRKTLVRDYIHEHNGRWVVAYWESDSRYYVGEQIGNVPANHRTAFGTLDDLSQFMPHFATREQAIRHALNNGVDLDPDATDDEAAAIIRAYDAEMRERYRPLTLEEAAAELGVSAATLRQQAANGRLQTEKRGNLHLVERSEVEAYREQYLRKRD